MKRRLPAFLLALVALVAIWGPNGAAQSYSSSPGTTSQTWRLGSPSGPIVQNNAGAIEARNAGNSAFSVVRGASPAAGNDLVTKVYADGQLGGVPFTPLGSLSGQVPIYDSSHTEWHAEFLPITGDAMLGSGTFLLTVQGIQGTAVPAVPGSGTTVLTDTTGTLSWSAPTGGITQLTGDGTAGPGSGSQAFTLATVNGSPGSFGSSSTIPSLVVNGKGLITSIGGNTVAAPLASATGTLALTQEGAPTGSGFAHVTSGAWDSASRAVNVSGADITGIEGAANGGSGIASPTAHDVLLGEGSSAFGLAAPGTAGLPLCSNGATSDPTFQSLSLAGSGVTGVLPIGNQASQTMGGDGSGTTAALVVNKISAASAVVISQPSFAWTATASAPGLTQTTGAAASTPQSFTITPQTFNASSTTNVTNTPGGVTVALQAPGTNTVTGNEAEFKITRGGTPVVQIGPQPGGGSATSGIWLFAGASAPTNANYAIQQTATTTFYQAPVAMQFIGAGNLWAQIVGSGSNRGTQLGYPGTATFGGGDDVVGISDALTIPTAAATSGGLALYSSSHQLETNAASIQFSRLVTSPVFQQAQQTTDTAPPTTIFKGGDAFGSAVTNIVGGQANFSGGAGAAGGISGPAQLQTGNADTTVLVSHNLGVLGFQGGLTETLVHTNSGFTTQQAKFDAFAKGGTSTMGGTLVTATSAIALASGHSVMVRCHGVSTVTTAGTFNAVGDSAEQSVEFLIKNVGGTVSQVGSTTSISKIVDSSYNSTSTAVGWNNAGTTIGCVMVPVVNTAGGSPVATVTVWGEAAFN